MSMATKPDRSDGTRLNHGEHDFCVLLAEGLHWLSAAESVGWRKTTVNGKLYYLMKLFGTPLRGNFKANMAALVEEVKDRDYQSQIYCFMYDDEDPRVALEELGAELPRFFPPLPRRKPRPIIGRLGEPRPAFMTAPSREVAE